MQRHSNHIYVRRITSGIKIWIIQMKSRYHESAKTQEQQPPLLFDTKENNLNHSFTVVFIHSKLEIYIKSRITAVFSCQHA